MTRYFRENGHIIFLILFFISVFPFLGKLSRSKEGVKSVNELFRPELLSLNSMEKVIAYSDSVYKAKNFQTFDTAAYVRIVSSLIKERFYHGLSHYKISENWIAFLSGKLLWSHLSAIVKSDDILKYPYGLCSQQTIVFMDVLRHKNISVRTVGLGLVEGPGHFLCEVHYNDSWHLHDVTLEPQWNKLVNDHESVEYYISRRDSLYLVYDGRLTKKTFDKIFENVAYGKKNEFPAKKMLLFHNVTLVLTYLIPVFFLFMFWVFFRRKQRQ